MLKWWEIFRSSSPALEPVVKTFRNDMILLAALDNMAFLDGTLKNGTEKPGGAGGHDHLPTLLTGVPFAEYRDFFETAGGPSIDQVIGRAVADKANIPFPALVIGGRTESGYQQTISYKGRDDGGITPENSPARLFKTLFSGRNLVATPSTARWPPVRAFSTICTRTLVASSISSARPRSRKRWRTSTPFVTSKSRLPQAQVPRAQCRPARWPSSRGTSSTPR